MAAREAISTRMFWTLVTVVFVSTLALNGVIVHLSALLTDRGVAAGDAALVMSVMGAANFCGRIATGLLLDRFSAIRVSFVLLCCAAAGTLLLASASSVPSGIIAAALIGAGMGGEMDITPYLLSRYFGLRSMSTLYGLNWTAWGFGGLVGPILLGRTFDATGSYAGALLACAAGTTLVALLVLTLPPVARRSEVQVGAAG